MQQIYAIIDDVAGEIGPVVSMRHDAVATRMFADLINQPNGAMAKHPQDYRLLRLGTIDEVGNITPEIKEILTGSALVAASQTPNLEITK